MRGLLEGLVEEVKMLHIVIPIPPNVAYSPCGIVDWEYVVLGGSEVLCSIRGRGV